MQLDPELELLKEQLYDICSLQISNYQVDKECVEYSGNTYQIEGLKIIGRNAKKTPIKDGFFVTLWKRNGDGPIQPIESTEDFDYSIITARENGHCGVFIFPKFALINHGVLKSSSKPGKRAFRIYPPWEETNSKLALKSQKWQSEYFLELNSQEKLDCQLVKNLLNLR